MNPSESDKPNCSFFRARKRPNQTKFRQREKSSSDSDHEAGEEDDQNDSDQSDIDSDEGNVVVRINRGNKRRGLDAGFSSKIRSNRVKKIINDNDSSSTDDEDDMAKRSRVGVAFSGTGNKVTGPADMGATATVEIDTEESKDARAIEERARKVRSETENPLEDKTYKGINSYAKYIEKKDTAAGSAVKMSARGPQRAPANIRATVRWDYAPDICKDYKETGFCGFGDSCKFMHDRSDYKFGWQLEREMQEGTYDQDDDTKYEISSDEEDIPFKCFICKESFTNPVVTKCEHYFCEKCALNHYKKSQRCHACGKQTGGVFNPAKNIIAKLEKLKSNTEEERSGDNDSESEEIN